VTGSYGNNGNSGDSVAMVTRELWWPWCSYGSNGNSGDIGVAMVTVGTLVMLVPLFSPEVRCPGGGVSLN